MFDGLNGYTFVLFGLFSTINTFFVFFVMKETKGLTEHEVKMLYVAEKDRVNYNHSTGLEKQSLRTDELLDGNQA